MLLSPLLSYISFGVLGMRPIDFYFRVVFVIYGFLFVAFSHKKLTIPNFAVFALLWAVYLFIWTFFNGDMARRGLVNVLLNNTSLAIFFIIVIVYNTRFSKGFVKRLIPVVIITVVITAIFSIIQFFDSSFFNAGPYWREGASLEVEDIYRHRRSSLFGFIDRNALGLSFIPLLSVLVGFLVYSKKRLLIPILIMGATTAFLSNTRYVMVAFIIVSLQLIVTSGNKLKGLYRYALVGGIVLVFSLQIIQYIGYDLQSWYEQRLFREGSIEETTRFGAIYTFMHFFPNNYLFGNGVLYDEAVTTFSRSAIGSSHIHVGYLSHLVAYGIVGCFFLYGFWFLLGLKLFKTARRTNYWGSLFAFLTFWWAFATFSQSSIFYYGLIFALVFDKHYSDGLT